MVKNSLIFFLIVFSLFAANGCLGPNTPPIPTVTPGETASPIITPEETPSPMITPEETPALTLTPTATVNVTFTPTVTTATPLTPTATSNVTPTPTVTVTDTPPTPTVAITESPPTPTPPTPTATVTETPPTPTPPTPTATVTVTITPTVTLSGTPPTPTNTPTATRTPTPTPSASSVSIGEVAGGRGSYGHGSLINFGKTFSTTPVVVVNAYVTDSGAPLIASFRPDTVNTTRFEVVIHDLEKNPVYSNVTVQWVAIIPNPAVEIQANYVSTEDGSWIYFEHSFPSTPRIICSAYDYTTDQNCPLMAAPYDIYNDRFYVTLRDAYGERCQGNLSYIAIIQPQNVNLYQEAAMNSGYQSYNDNQHVGTNMADTIICSAQKDNFARAVAARNNSATGFDISVIDYLGTSVDNSWVSWLALGFK